MRFIPEPQRLHGIISKLGIAVTRAVRKNSALPNHGAKQPARRSIDACFHRVRCSRYNFCHSPIRCAMEKQGKFRRRRHLHCHKSNPTLYNDSYQFSRFVGNIRPAEAWTKSSTAVYKGGFGMPLETLSPSQVSLILKVRFHLLQNSQTLNMKLMMCALCAYSLTITMVKISILLLYRRIFNTAAFRRKTLIVGILCITWFLVAASLEIFQCQPVSDAFIPEMLYTGHCIDIQAYYEGVTATNMAIDIIMLLLPVHMVWGLSLPIRQRILLSSIFMLGGL